MSAARFGTPPPAYSASSTKLFQVSSSHLLLTGVLLAGYALLEAIEAVGLWLSRRWAEYLTLVATAILLIPEVYELAHRLSALKVLTLVINLAVVVYLLVTKRLFGLRGGGRAERAERERDSGWAALERTLPASRRTPSAGTDPASTTTAPPSAATPASSA